MLDYLNGGSWELVAEFVEVESGKQNGRPEQAKALEACRRLKATLVIAKLDRLSRNLAFIATLMDSGTDFVAVDNPHATRLTLHILAAVAEHEREMISTRTRARPGRCQGPWDASRQSAGCRAAALGRATLEAATAQRDANLLPIVRKIEAARVTSRNGIAAELNRRGVRTARGRTWTHVQVGMLLDRVKTRATIRL